MSLTAPNVVETIPVAIGSTIVAHTATQFNTRFAGNTKTPTANFSAVYQGHTLSFRKGVPFVTNPALLAVLTAQNAPII